MKSLLAVAGVVVLLASNSAQAFGRGGLFKRGKCSAPQASSCNACQPVQSTCGGCNAAPQVSSCNPGIPSGFYQVVPAQGPAVMPAPVAAPAPVVNPAPVVVPAPIIK